MSAKLELTGVWKKIRTECLEWPETNTPAKVVYENQMTGERIIRRFNQIGDLIFSNEDRYLKKPQAAQAV